MLINHMEIKSGYGKELNKYHSVEFYIDGIDFPYQFRIWNTAFESISVLIKDDSGLLKLIKEGDILEMKYYSHESVYPSEKIPTVVRHVTRENQGRLKGYYLVGLEIL
ncbi:MAG: hypothetical protein JW882_05895 [Deltaproteobacteria bacterium]|nr:hypothetical protein [Deltaproteobacteria bacterium]